MYSQYNYYQNNSNSQPQQQQATTSTANQVWNGQQWVSTNNATTNQQQQSYAQAAATQPQQGTNVTVGSGGGQGGMIIKHGKTHAELVQHYTSYYHHWNQQSQIAQSSLAALPPSHPATPSNNVQRDEMERREKWATYYAGNSAALAHYHLNLSNGQGGGGERPASPPVPPQMETQAATVAQQATAAVQQPAIAQQQPISMAISPKKKSRWDTQPTTGNAQGGDTNYYGPGKSNVNVTNSLTNLEASVIQNRGGGGGVQQQQGSGLYNNFVQNTKDDSFSTYTNPNNRGMKRKQMMESFNNEEEEGTAGYYGPSSTSNNNNTTTTSFFNSKKNSYEDDYLALDQPLGGASPTSKLSKKERKRQKKLKQQQQQSQQVTDMSGFNIEDKAMTDRANRFRGKGGIHSASSTPSSIANVDQYMGKTTIGGSNKKLNDVDYERMTVKGTCTKLEKEYLRLTSPPKAELVRPQSILQQHLNNLKHSYYKNNKIHTGSTRNIKAGKQRDYVWYCSQLKAIRQDLTVQRIINGFAINVYETHAKIALEEDDINEYNQSQTQLKELYDKIERNDNNSSTGGSDKGKKKKTMGKRSDVEDGLKNRNEFIAYRIIYYVFLSCNKKYEGGSSDIFKIMLQLTPEQRKDECINHALLVRAAVADNDYHKFFKLQDIAPNMGDYLMDKIVPSVRQGALQRMCKAYKPSVSAEFVLKELGFDVSSREEVEGGKAWMTSCGCKFDGELLNTKETVLREGGAQVKNSLI